MLDGTNHRHAARYRALKPEVTTETGRLGDELGATMRDHLRVCSDHGFACTKRRARPFLGRWTTADELDKDVDVIRKCFVKRFGPANIVSDPPHPFPLDTPVEDDR